MGRIPSPSVPNRGRLAAEVMRNVATWFARAPARAFAFVFLLSAAVRLALLPLAPLDPAWTIRWETGAVADYLVRTGEYTNPYALPTGDPPGTRFPSTRA